MAYQGNLLSKTLVIGIIFLFIGTSLIPGISGKNKILSSISINIIGNNSKDIYIDLITRNIGSDDDITVYLSNGDGTYGNRLDYYIGEEPRHIAVGDFNNDYNLDIVNTNLDKNYLSFLYGHGNGTFQNAQKYDVGHTTYAIFPYDFNSDGNLDISLGNLYHDNMSIMLGNGDGTFTLHYGCNIGNGPFRMLGEDFDNDGNIDLAFTKNYENNISILYGHGNGTFGFRLDITIGASARSTYMTSGDFNNDQNIDLAVVKDKGGWKQFISILLNLGNRSFIRQDHSSNAFIIAGISTADFNNDGIIDLVSSEWRNYPDDRIRILFGIGDGTFGNQKFIHTGLGPYDIISKDLNGDENIDLGVVHGSDDDIKIFFGDGTGNFSSGVAYPVGRSPRWLIAECLRSVPFIPIIDGPTSGKIGVRYEYNFSLSDPNKDKMHLRVDWGSGTPGKWYGPFDSGTKVKLNHTWSKKGTYSIKAQTQDSNGHLSEWSYLEITIPRSRATVNSLFQLLFDRFPLLEVFILRAMNLLR